MKSIGLARLGRDAEVRYMANGDAVANLSLAVTIYDKEAANTRGTQWVSGSMFGKQAEALAPYLVKGSVHCFALSDLKIEMFKNRDGVESAKLVARIDSVELGPRAEHAPTAAPAPRQAAPSNPKKGGIDGSPPQDMDDDIPF